VAQDQRKRMARGDTVVGEADIRVTQAATGNFDDDVIGRRIERREFNFGELTGRAC
jgi:hypothetical protein